MNVVLGVFIGKSVMLKETKILHTAVQDMSILLWFGEFEHVSKLSIIPCRNICLLMAFRMLTIDWTNLNEINWDSDSPSGSKMRQKYMINYG